MQFFWFFFFFSTFRWQCSKTYSSSGLHVSQTKPSRTAADFMTFMWNFALNLVHQSWKKVSREALHIHYCKCLVQKEEDVCYLVKPIEFLTYSPKMVQGTHSGIPKAKEREREREWYLCSYCLIRITQWCLCVYVWFEESFVQLASGSGKCDWWSITGDR